ncbi:MAG: hemerythrin domain-containing protein [Actinobacteria bacterium]|nr:hemerythrin domain-containing protein [Actinomycetota bacterium]
MPSAFDVLARDHEQVKQLLSQFEAAPAASGTNDSLLAARKKMAEILIIEESKHEAVEEMYFWPAVRKHLPDGDKLADQAISQEQEGKEVLTKLDKLEADDPEFDRLLGEFINAARDHIAFEETKVWPALRAALSDAESSELGEKLEQGEKTAPTRPHPHTPASPGVLKTAGPAAAAADRARDAATGRGRD